MNINKYLHTNMKLKFIKRQFSTTLECLEPRCLGGFLDQFLRLLLSSVTLGNFTSVCMRCFHP